MIATPASTLPTSTTSFVGRAEELAHIATLLADPACRLLTLLGPGGIGKTRLSLQAAAQHLDHFVDGVYFVPLTSISVAENIPSAIAAALERNFYSASEILSYLRERQILLVLDNFEHLLDGSDLLVEILQNAPHLKLLVTSRERLYLQEEWVLALEGLRVPQSVLTAPLESYPAAQLFAQRARQVQPNFSLTDHLQAVKTICQQVEGMPLGLELAASWLRVMSCEQIAEQVSSSIDFLTTTLRNVPERHRSLRAVFEQSWSLLSSAEKSGLARLAVFRGGFNLEAAEQVAGTTLPVLAGLVDKSLVRMHENGRYDLHELLRQYADDKLAEAGDTTSAADQHLCYFITLAETAETHVWGSEQRTWYDRLETEQDNLRAAITWALNGGDPEQGLRLTAALGWFFTERSRPHEGLNWLERALAATPNAPASLRAKAFNRAGELAGLMEGIEEIYAFCQHALTLARSVDDRLNTAWALSGMGYYPCLKHPPDPASLQMIEESIVIFREMEDTMGLNHALRRLAQMMLEIKDYARARALLEEAVVGAQAAGDRNALGQAYLTIGDIEWQQAGNFAQAMRMYETGLALFQEQGNRLGMNYALGRMGEAEHLSGHPAQAQYYCQQAMALVRDFAPTSNTFNFLITGIGSTSAALGEWERAVRLFGGGSRLFDYTDYNEHPLDKRVNADIQMLHETLGSATFNAAWEAGRAMSREQLMAYALQAPGSREPNEEMELPLPSQPPAPSQPLVEPLSERELEILRAVAAGHSNREIAAELFLALGTVKWYLNAINTKLGVSSRTQAVAQARSLGLIS